MKRKALFLVFLITVSMIRQSALAQRDVDNIICIGNGLMAIYESKADILQLFGPPYSSPSLLQMILSDTTIQVSSVREPGTTIWTHELRRRDTLIGTITDLMDTGSAVLIRKFMLTDSVSFSLRFMDKIKIIRNTASYQANNITDALLAESPRGIGFYNDYPMPFKQYLQIAAKNNVHIVDSVDGQYTVNCTPGEGYLYFIGGPLYPQCISNTQSAFSSSYETILRRSRYWWQKFTSRRLDFDRLLPANTPDRNKLLKTIDAVSINIKTQQSVEGGVLAGHNYHLAYVRDQYGVSRCLLKLGYYREAHNILDFYWKIWKSRGQLHNAQGIGIDAFHIHENDEVEITGYLIIQTFDYMERTGDLAFVKTIFPMLEWAWNSQKKHLVKNMLPFNGDETYVAGGILPRSCLIDGSAEATLLFITGGGKLIAWAEKNKWWNADIVLQNKKILQETILHYRENFFDRGYLYCNNPKRSEGISLPAFRHGVCEALGQGCEIYGWTQKNENNRYLCPVCFVKTSLPKAIPTRYLIQSVSLMPLYIGATIFTDKEIKTMVDGIVSYYHNTGKLPSRPDGDITVGYDYGLLLYNLVRLDNFSKEEIYEKMLSLLDDTGSWVEYYDNGKATGTRYRPWESGINLEAAILFAERFEK